MSEEKPIVVDETFGLLTVKAVGPGARCEVECQCGRRRTYEVWKLRNNKARSCGCVRGKPTLLAAWGETKSLAAWSRDGRCQVKYVTMVQRLGRGWTPEDAIGTPTVPKTECNNFKGGKRGGGRPRANDDEKRRLLEAAGLDVSKYLKGA